MEEQDVYTLQTSTQLKTLLVSFRKQAKLSQAALADRLGISQQSYAQIEANPMITNVERLYTILRLLGVELQLKRRDDPPAPTHLIAYPLAATQKETRRQQNTSLAEPADKVAGAASSGETTSPPKLTPRNPGKKDQW